MRSHKEGQWQAQTVNSSVHIVTCFLEIFIQNLHHTCHLVAALRITEAYVEGEIGPYV